MTVHSDRLAAVSSLDTTGRTIYTAPAGTRVIVKSVIVWNHAATPTLVTLTFQEGGVSYVSMEFLPAAKGAAGSTIFQECWFVLRAGDDLYAVAAASYTEMLVSGSVLTL